MGDVGTVSIVKIESLSPRVEKLKVKKVNKRFVPELKKVVSVSGFLCLWVFCISVYLCIRILDMLQNNNNRKIKTGGRRNDSKLNNMKEINAWAVFLVIYLRPFFMWTKEELKQMGQRTRKLDDA